MASAAAATKSNNNSNNSNNSNTNKIKIISFNVASPDAMCFNMHIEPGINLSTREPCYENKEPTKNTEERASLIVKQLNLQNVNNDVDFMCFQEMFDELHTNIDNNFNNHLNYSRESTTTQKRDISIYYNNKWKIDKIHINYNKKLLIEFELISNSKIKYLLCNIHNKGTNNDSERKSFFIDIITTITKSKNPSIIVGDFNYDVIQDEFVGFKIWKKEGNEIDVSSYHRWAWNGVTFKDKGKNFKLNDYILTYNINNKITITRIPEYFYKKIGETEINFQNRKDKVKAKGKAIQIRQIQTKSIEVPYKCDIKEDKTVECIPNFEGPEGFPSDHTMNIYEIDLNKPLNPYANEFMPLQQGIFPDSSESQGTNHLLPTATFRTTQPLGQIQGPFSHQQGSTGQLYPPTGQPGLPAQVYYPQQQGYYPQQLGYYLSTGQFVPYQQGGYRKTKKTKKTKKSIGKSIKKIRKKTKLPKKSKKSKKTKLPKNKNVN